MFFGCFSLIHARQIFNKRWISQVADQLINLLESSTHCIIQMCRREDFLLCVNVQCKVTSWEGFYFLEYFQCHSKLFLLDLT